MQVNLNILSVDDKEELEEMIRKLNEEGAFDPLTDYQKELVLNGAPLLVKRTIIRMALTHRLEAIRAEAKEKCPESFKAAGLPNDKIEIPSSEDFLIDLKRKLDEFERIFSNREENISSETSRLKMVGEIDRMGDKKDALLSKATAEQRQILLTEVPVSADHAYRRQLRLTLGRLNGWMQMLCMDAEQLDQKRLQFLEDHPEALEEAIGEWAVALITPVTSETSDEEREVLNQAMERLERRAQYNERVAEADRQRQILLNQFPLACAFIEGRDHFVVNQPVQSSIDFDTEKHDMGAFKALSGIEKRISSIANELPAKDEEAKKAKDAKLSSLKKKHEGIVNEYEYLVHTMKANPETGEPSFRQMLMLYGPVHMLDSMVESGQSPFRAMEQLDHQLGVVLETFRTLPERAKEKARQESQRSQRSDGRQGRHRKPDPQRRARQVERSQSGPKKGVNPPANKHGGKAKK